MDKLVPETAGHYQVAIGGSGHGHLVDGFIDTLLETIEGWPNDLDGQSLNGRIKNILLNYHRNEVAASPATDKQIDFVLCVKKKDDENAAIHLWELRGPSIRRIKTYSLIGWEEAIYKHNVQKHYHKNIHSLQAMLLGVHVLSLAKSTSNNVGGPTKIVTATCFGGIRAIPRGDVEELERRVALFDSMLDGIRLQLSDTSITIDGYESTLTRFHVLASETHQSLITQVLERKFTGGHVDLSSLDDPYLRLPTFEDSFKSLQTGWEKLQEKRKSIRGIAETAYSLAGTTNAITKFIVA